MAKGKPRKVVSLKPGVIDPPAKPVKKLNSQFLSLLIPLSIVAVTLAVFWPVSEHEFIGYDDGEYVAENPNVRTGPTFKSLIWALATDHAANWHPLTWLSHMADVSLFGLDPGWHHFMNLLFHCANTFLLFTVLRKMTGMLWQSGFAAALFALHPLHVESVAWVAERKDVLSTFFWMLTLLAYIRYAEAPGKKAYALVFACLALGLLAKPMLVTLPFVLLLLDYWPFRRWKPGACAEGGGSPVSTPNSSSLRSLVMEKLPLFTLSAISSFITYLVQQRGGAVGTLESFPLHVRLVNALVSYLEYLGKMFWPSNLSFFYPYPKELPLVEATAALVALIVISFLALRWRRRHPYLPVGWFWYVGTLVPVIGLVQVGTQAMADRYTYVPLMGTFLLAAWAIPDFLSKWRHRKLILAVGAGLILAVLIPLTRNQVLVWRTSLSLYSHAIQATPENHLAHNNLANALIGQGKLQKAIFHSIEALRLKPNSEKARFNLGTALARRGKLAEAIAEFREAIRIKPDYAEAYNSLGVALGLQGEMEEAMASYYRALAIKPHLAEGRLNLGNLLADRGKLAEAIQHLREALRLRPESAEAHNNLGTALDKQGNLKEATAHFQEALRIKPNYDDAQNNLGVALGRQARHAEAIVHFQQALRINPRYLKARYNLGVALEAQGRLNEAIQCYREAVRSHPDFAPARFSLAQAYLKLGHRDSAWEEHRILQTLNPDLAKRFKERVRSPGD